MKYCYLILLMTLISCSQLQRNLASSPKHVVFDIDWTIVSEVKNVDTELLQSGKLIEVEGHYYVAHNGLREFIANILNKRDVQISFFSGGKKSRNAELLKKIKLQDGRSLSDIAYKILSSDDLIRVPGVPDSSPFADKFKKDLSLVTHNLDDLIMFDDVFNFVATDAQREHVFYVGMAFEYFDSFAKTQGLSGKYVPKTQEEWLLNNNRLIILNEAFNEAYKESKSSNISFSEAMKNKEKLLNLEGHKWNVYSESYYKKFFKISGPAPQDCKAAMKAFF